jgi:hypothetical protein
MKIIAHIPDKNDATSFYRGVGPLSHLTKNNSQISVTYKDAFSWSELMGYHVLFIQRPCTPTHEQLIIYAKQMGLNIWIDYDDDLLSVPESNPAYAIYASQETQGAIKGALNLADLVTVSTENLKQSFKEHSGNIVVVNNAVNLDVLPNRDIKGLLDKSGSRFIWRGSQTHQRDVMSVEDDLIKFLNNHDSTIEFIGDKFWNITDKMSADRFKYTNPMDIMSYMNYIHASKAKCFIVPLQDNSFNRSKSNITWLEATMSGMLTIAPYMEEWNKPGILKYDTGETFYDCMERASKMPDSEKKRRIEESFDCIMDSYTLEKTNYIRLTSLNNIHDWSR